jgi:hypothetical protein
MSPALIRFLLFNKVGDGYDDCCDAYAGLLRSLPVQIE